MAGQASQNDDMQSRLEQQQRLQERREWILQQPNERCPRCDSLDTKFAYFNNHRETQPRYLCKGCRKYWTKGGKQRTAAPVGGAAISLGGGLIMVPATSLSTWTLLGSSGRSSFTGGPGPQVQSNNIQPPLNVIGNAPNSFTPVWRAPNPGLGHFQPSVQNNIRPPPNVVQPSVHPPNVVQPSVHNNIQPLPPNVVHPSGSPPNVVPNLPNSFRAPGWQVPPNQGLRPLQPFVGSNIQPNFNNYVPNPFEAAQPAPNHGLAPLPPSLDNYTYHMGGATS